MSVLTTISEIWPIIGSFILFIAWNVRLESKVLNLESKVKEHSDNMNKIEEKLWSRLDSIHAMFSDISTKLTRVETIIEERTRDNHI